MKSKHIHAMMIDDVKIIQHISDTNIRINELFLNSTDLMLMEVRRKSFD